MRAYQDMVFTTAARLVGRDAQAEDIAQETFVRAYAHFDRLRGNPSCGGWLKTVATNLAINHLNRHRRRWRLFSDLAHKNDEDEFNPLEWADPDTGAFAALDVEQQRQAIEKALQSLPDQQRAALVLFHFEDMTYQEIAQRLGVSLAKVKTDIHRARMSLLPLLEGSGISSKSLED